MISLYLILMSSRILSKYFFIKILSLSLSLSSFAFGWVKEKASSKISKLKGLLEFFFKRFIASLWEIRYIQGENFWSVSKLFIFIKHFINISCNKSSWSSLFERNFFRYLSILSVYLSIIRSKISLFPFCIKSTISSSFRSI